MAQEQQVLPAVNSFFNWVKKENVILCDSKGVIYKGRTEGMNPYKEELAADTPCRTLEEALVGADVLSVYLLKMPLSQRCY
jgi:malic enzyme